MKEIVTKYKLRNLRFLNTFHLSKVLVTLQLEAIDVSRLLRWRATCWRSGFRYPTSSPDLGSSEDPIQ
jgi:hypothetical protein